MMLPADLAELTPDACEQRPRQPHWRRAFQKAMRRANEQRIAELEAEAAALKTELAKLDAENFRAGGKQ